MPPRQLQRDLRATKRRSSHRHVTAVRPSDATEDGQAKAEAGAVRAGFGAAEEGVEDALAVGRVDPTASVFHANASRLVVLRNGDANLDLPARELDRVVEQVAHSRHQQ